MSLRLHGILYSSPFRAAAMTAECLKVKYEFVKVNPLKGDALKPDFIKLNPQHNIPLMEHGGFVLNESRAIAGYIAQEFDKSAKLYPHNPKVNSKINQRLFFDSNVLYKRLYDITLPMILRKKGVSQERFSLMEEATYWANDMVKESGYMTDTDHLTIADICLLATYSSIHACEVISLDPYKELNEWASRISSGIPNYDSINGKGATDFGQLYKSNLNK